VPHDEWTELLPDLPRDADGDSIRRLVHEGSDLAEPMSVDFFVAVPDEKSGRAVADAAQKLGFRTHVDRDGESDAWTVYCAREMLVTHEAVVAAQVQLDEISRSHGGRADGWGTFGNA
jgi:hypothetical protein